ncbi:type IV secretory system conjugative DNA transfer family protein [Kribbella sandramycini]|uniref:Type IV secretory pathway TraG/TraD family ATPase VirD4 n=1 Tax=Kribbella sandramycini TaxID=60450 RepID=A0A7Y4P1H6_9ACTN|nr:type IV secretory system conjugative DNA transfer family protein [Kribbella sandramycini]MBB6565860.1 type IV secretory pathway TraG/TraD family ATPase VirD4 [Kribbella sandramycini]NOL42124.1 type IV secretory system conjugative DNA transfer family protein [Kribbella sandramycini]
MSNQWPAIPPFTTDPRRQVFLGWDARGGYKRCWSAPEDSVGIIGPPRYGKTSGLIIPSVLWWEGPLVCTSTRGDILQFTGNRRRALAAPYGGKVLVYDPFGSEYPELSMRWSPLADCENPSVCYRRVAAMTAVAGQGVSDGDHWRGGAAAILRAYFHAAALEGLPVSVVRRWLTAQETRDPTAILRLSSSPGAMWADDLDAVKLLGDRERGSFYSVARNTLEATSEPTVLASCSANDLDIDEFLNTRSSLFIIGPSHQQQAIAPLMAGLVDSIAQRASELAAARGGRLDPPLLLALDEIANIAPLQSLPSLVSEGGGRGIVTMWATQSLAQLRNRYGVEQQAAILAATTAKLIFGGLSNGDDLHNISSWAGEERQSMTSTNLNPNAMASAPGTVGVGGSLGAANHTVSSIYRPALPISSIQMLPPFHAWLFWRSEPPFQTEARPAGAIPEFATLQGFTP